MDSLPSPLTHGNTANTRDDFACLMMRDVCICEFCSLQAPSQWYPLNVFIIWVKSHSTFFLGIKNLGFKITSV